MPAQLRPMRHQPNRRKRPTIALTATFTGAYVDPTLTLTFPTPVVLNGIPQFMTDTADLPNAATQPDPMTVVLTYPAAGAAATVTVPQRDPAIRTSTGGYVGPGTFPIV